MKESGKVFAIPTYFFLANMIVLLTAGAIRLATADLPKQTLHRSGLGKVGHPGNGLFMGAALFVVLRAFASGGAAVTGVEAISNGVPAFKEPAWRNARTTLVWMGSLLGIMFLGLSILAGATHAAPFEKGTPTVISQVGKLVYGGGVTGHLLFYLLQAGTMLILVLAANTSFADFPRLASFAAADGFLPRQLAKRGHRLVFSNCMMSLAIAAAVLVLATDAKVSRLIPLYAIGVFTSFTLSQSGMAKHHWTRREEGWRAGLFVNGTGAVLSLLVDVVRHDAPKAAIAPILRRHVVLIFIDQLDLAAARAIHYARSLTPDVIRAVHFAVDTARATELRQAWTELGLSRVPLDIVECPDRRLTRAAVNLVAETLIDGETEVTVLLPRLEYDRIWHRLLHDRTARSIATALNDVLHASVTLIPYHLGRNRPRRPLKPVKTKDNGHEAAPAMPLGILVPDDVVPIGTLHHRDRATVAGRVRQSGSSHGPAW